MRKTIIITLLITVISCQPIYELTNQDRKDLKTYPKSFLLANNKKKIIKARKIEITDSLRQSEESDLSLEIQEEINTGRD